MIKNLTTLYSIFAKYEISKISRVTPELRKVDMSEQDTLVEEWKKHFIEKINWHDEGLLKTVDCDDPKCVMFEVFKSPYVDESYDRH